MPGPREADYAETIWSLPPLDLAVHERSFGQWRADATPKPAVAVATAFAARRVARVAAGSVDDTTWIDIDDADFYRARPSYRSPPRQEE